MPGSVVHLAMLDEKQAGPSPPKIVNVINFLWLFSIYRCAFRFVYIQSEFKQEKKTNGKN